MDLSGVNCELAVDSGVAGIRHRKELQIGQIAGVDIVGDLSVEPEVDAVCRDGIRLGEPSADLFLRGLSQQVIVPVQHPERALLKVRGAAALPPHRSGTGHPGRSEAHGTGKKCLATLDVVMSRLYEDYALGEISKEKYKKMTADYEAEQERLKLEIEATLAESTLERRKTA
jgi:hypothetical protein